MNKIALTGGIGTGKTFIAKYFVNLGIPVFNADDEAKKLYSKPDIIKQIDDCFGKDVMSNGAVDLSKLSELLFDNPDRIYQINAIIHPVVMEHFRQWAENQHSDAVILESAIIFEAGLAHLFNFIIVVDAPLEIRIQRIMQRNSFLTREDIIKRISAQMEQSLKCEKADLVIYNG